MFMIATGARGPVWVDREAQFAMDTEEESYRGEAIFDAAAGHCNEQVWMLGRRWKCSCSCSKTWLYSSAVTMPVECFFRSLRALWGDRVVRKYWVRSVWGTVGGQNDVVMFGRM